MSLYDLVCGAGLQGAFQGDGRNRFHRMGGGRELGGQVCSEPAIGGFPTSRAIANGHRSAPMDLAGSLSSRGVALNRRPAIREQLPLRDYAVSIPGIHAENGGFIEEARTMVSRAHRSELIMELRKIGNVQRGNFGFVIGIEVFLCRTLRYREKRGCHCTYRFALNCPGGCSRVREFFGSVHECHFALAFSGFTCRKATAELLKAVTSSTACEGQNPRTRRTRNRQTTR